MKINVAMSILSSFRAMAPVILPLGFLLLCCSLAHAQQSAESAARIFDGKSLDGWHIMEKPKGDKRYATTDNFLVRDGAIVGRQFGNRNGGMLISDKQYDDFELELDFKVDWGCDSGLILRCNQAGEGIQIMLDYLETGCVGFPHGQGTGGYISRPIELLQHDGAIVARDRYDAVDIDKLIYAIDANGWNELWMQDKWNHLKVRCVGTQPRITSWINGVRIMEMDGSTFRGRHLTDEKDRNWEAESAWNQQHIQEFTGNRGHIALQIHPGGRWLKEGSARFRSIQVREVSP